MQPVAILGIGRTDYAPKPSISIPEMVHQAVQAALADAGLTIAQVDAVVTASVDLYDGLTASNIAVTEVVGAVMKPEARIAGDGLLAACHAAMTILAGAYATVLVVAHCKASMGDRWGISNWTFDPIYQQPLGLDDRSAATLQAAVLGSPAPPLPCPISDGAAAIILSTTLKPVLSEAEVTSLTRSPNPQSFDGVYAERSRSTQDKSAIRNPQLIGMGWALDEHYLGDRDLADSPALREATRRAYSLAGVSDPERDLSVAELSDHFDYQHELWASVLFGETSEVSETSEVCPPLLNPSGGLKRSVPPFVAGLDRLIEVVHRLREAPGLGLAHGCWGPAGQGQVVVIAGRN